MCRLACTWAHTPLILLASCVILGKKCGCCPFPGWLGWSQYGDGATFPPAASQGRGKALGPQPSSHMTAIVEWQTVAFQRLHPEPPATVVRHSCFLPSGLLPASATPRPCVAELELYVGLLLPTPAPQACHTWDLSLPPLSQNRTRNGGRWQTLSP